MVPIHDTDIAEERWSQAEWQHYELWEKVEAKIKRRKWLWITGAGFVFLALSSVPIITDRLPWWNSLSASRKLANEIGALKRDATLHRAAYRIRFDADGSLRYAIEKGASCGDSGATVVRKGALLKKSRLDEYALISPKASETLGISGLGTSFCYDYLAGSEAVLTGQKLSGFAIAPVKDLASEPARKDRVSVLLLAGPSAEISFE